MKKLLSILTIITMVVSLAYGTIGVAALDDTSWILDKEQVNIPTLEGTTSQWQGMQIDATNGKFSPNTGYTQINSGTVITVPVAANENGATITINVYANEAQVSALNDEYTGNPSNPIVIPVANTDATDVAITFIGSNISYYISSIVVSYNEEAVAYPGNPGEVVASDQDYILNGNTTLVDENGISVSQLEGKKGSFDDVLVDATNGKFSVRTNDIQVNSGTILYIPVTTDIKGVSLIIAGTTDGSTPIMIDVDNQAVTTNEVIDLTVNETRYVTVSFVENGYISAIDIDYGSDTGLPVPSINANDKTWDFGSDSNVTRPNLQGNSGEYDGVVIDATIGKFSPRDGDSQVNGGTTLYLPLAADKINLTVNGNNYNNLTIALDGQEIKANVETTIVNDETRYVPLTFSGNGSCYLYSITVDYVSDDQTVSKTVIVGNSANATYKTINEALANETSSLSSKLIIALEDGTYSEKVMIDSPNVTLTSLSGDATKVIIEESYYSSNTFDESGNFVPQDEKDLGTNNCATVLVSAKGTNFTATNITIQNSYNVLDHLEAGSQTPAVALYIGADKVALSNCRIIGRQDTLYVNGTGNRAYFDNCYIEGTVDFVFGKANAYFDNCTLHMAAFTGRDSGYYTAPNTEKGDTGLVFNQCTLTADASIQEASLGRPWQNECYSISKVDDQGRTIATNIDYTKPRDGYENISSATTFINCAMNDQIISGRFSRWTRRNEDGKTVSVTYDKTVRFYEYNSTDLNGELLNPDNYSIDTDFAHMEKVDTDAKLAQLLNDMRIGSNGWLPDFNINIETPEPDIPVDEGQEIPEQQPVVTPSEGENNETVINDSTSEAIKTGDDVNFVLSATGLILAGAYIVITYRKRNELNK